MIRSNVRGQASSSSRSASERIRDEWAVATRNGRRWPGLAQRHDRPGGHGLGPVHVGVDDVGADLGEVRGKGRDRDRVVGLVDDQDRDTGAQELAHGTPRRQRDDRDVVASRVDPGDQGVEVLLGAAVGAGGEDLDDADATAWNASAAEAASRQRIPGHRCAHLRTPVADEQALDGLVVGAPLVLVGLVAAQEVEPAPTGREGPLDEGVDHQ